MLHLLCDWQGIKKVLVMNMKGWDGSQQSGILSEPVSNLAVSK